MTTTDKKFKLVQIYFYICKRFEIELKYVCERFSNNHEPEFTDQEVITIYLYSMHLEYRFRVKHIYEFACEYLRDWFPKLPSYEAFTTRINRLCEVFRVLSQTLLSEFVPEGCNQDISLIDSMPVITCSAKRKPKVALEITDKGYCSTKSIYYFGLKLHGLGFYHKKHLPHPEQLIFSKASVNDINSLKIIASTIENRTYFGDKIYGHAEYWDQMEITNNCTIFTPIKNIKGESEVLRQRDYAYNKLYSKAVSAIREPIESLFNWLIEKTDIQRASKVRSTKGLLTYVFGRIAAAYIYFIF